MPEGSCRTQNLQRTSVRFEGVVEGHQELEDSFGDHDPLHKIRNPKEQY